MKEYKVITPSLGFRNKSEKLQDILNKYAKEGWVANTISTNQHGGIIYLIFERNKNR